MSSRKSIGSSKDAADAAAREKEAAAAAAALAASQQPASPPPSVLDELLSAVIHGRVETVAALANRGNCNFADASRHLTLLMWAAEAGEPAVAELLLQCGAHQHLEDPGGFTALHHAAHRKNAEIVALLLKYNSSFENVNAPSGKSRRTPLILGAMQGSVGVVKAILGFASGRGGTIKLIADVDLRDSAGMSAIDHAAFRGFEDIVKLLAANGAAANAALYFASDGAVHAQTTEQKKQYEGLVRFMHAPWAEQSVVTP